jgi:predicted transcriptional regulator
MEPDEAAFGDVQFLTGSPQRFAVLSALCETPARPCDLRDRVDATRTTVQRILAGFRERDWVYKRDGQYHPTVTGRRVLTRYRSLLTDVERAREFGPVATHLEPIADRFPAALLTESTMTRGTEQDPLAAVSRLIDRFRSAEGEVRAISPIVSQSFNEVAAELLDSDVEMTLVVDRDVIDRSASDFPTAFERGIEHGGIDIFVHETPLSFGLLLDDTGCCLAVYDDGNNLRATIESADESVIEWAHVQYERRKERADPLETLVADSRE